jgi:hypothetical protein
MRARRLKQIADWINANLADAGYRAEVVLGYCSTDTHIAGTRFRRPGQGRHGYRLFVYRHADGDPTFRTLNARGSWPREGEHVVLDHNAAETYRCNQEVEDWLARELRDLGRAP